MLSHQPVAPGYLAAAVLAVCSASLFSQTPRQFTAQDYAHAERFMPYNVNELVDHTFAPPTFLPDGRFWYRDTAADGVSFILVDPVARTKVPAFDQVKLAAALNAAMTQVPVPEGMEGPRKLNARSLPITNFTYPDAGTVLVSLGSTVQMRCSLGSAMVCTPVEPVPIKRAGKPNTPRAGQSSTQVGGECADGDAGFRCPARARRRRSRRTRRSRRFSAIGICGFSMWPAGRRRN